MVFGPIMAIFQIFFFGTIGQEKVFYDILKRKNTFLRYKNKKSKKSKNWHFSKGHNPWFLVQKWPFFQFFFLAIIRQENVFYDILEQKNAFLGYKNQKFKKSNPWFSSKKWSFFLIFFLRHYRPRKCLLRYSKTKKHLPRL